MSEHYLDEFNVDEVEVEVPDVELDEKTSQNNENYSDIEEESTEDDNMEGGGDESEVEDDDDFGVEEEKNELPDEKSKSKLNQLEENFSDDDDDEDEPDENYLMKFDKEIRKNYLVDFHPETLTNNYAEIQAMINIIRDDRGIIVDQFHKTLPFLTKYEKTRVLGQRTKQINSGSNPYIDIKQIFNGKRIIDGSLIAQKELELKRIPFIIRRPLPNGGSEYWRLQDLDLIN